MKRCFERKGPPRYEEAFRLEKTRMVLKALAKRGGVARLSEVQDDTGLTGSLVYHHLNRLWSLGIVEREVPGTYRLLYRTPLCFLFDEGGKVPYAYVGLLGRRQPGREPEPLVAQRILEGEGIKPELIYVLTSPEALNQWRDAKLPYQWVLCYEEEVIDIDAVKERVRPQLQSLLRSHVVIMDCTSLTKPATIAYYELAREYRVPLIYVYEDTKRLKWLISKEDLLRSFTPG